MKKTKESVALGLFRTQKSPTLLEKKNGQVCGCEQSRQCFLSYLNNKQAHKPQNVFLF